MCRQARPVVGGLGQYTRKRLVACTVLEVVIVLRLVTVGFELVCGVVCEEMINGGREVCRR